MKPTVGLIGLGAMGSGMAQTLRRAGFELKVFDVRAGVAEFVQVLAEAVIIVLLVSFFSLGLRTGLVVAL